MPFRTAPRTQAAAGGARLGAGPEGERKIEGTRASPGCDDPSRLADGDAAAAARGTFTSARWAARSTDTAAAAANDANGSAPAGDIPTNTAAHAAASLPRIRGSLRPARALSMTNWDERFLRGDELHGGLPSPPLPQAIEGLQPGTALDLACGAGRHAIWLAERGWKVHAIDSSRVGIQRMLDEAYRKRVKIEAEVADLEAPDFRIERQYDLIIDFYFLHRPLFEQIKQSTRRFVAAIHVGHGRFLLEPGELLRTFADWKIVHYREGESPEGGHHGHATAELITLRE